MPYNVSELNEKAAINALENQTTFEANKQIILEEKTKLIQQLQALDLIKKIYPSDANFLLVEVEDANQLYQKLIEHKVITRNRNNLVKNCLRITIGKPFENRQLLIALKNI